MLIFPIVKCTCQKRRHLMIKKQRIYRLFAVLIMATVLFPIVTGIGCTVIVYEDGTGWDTCNSEHISRERVLRSQANCQPLELSFVSEAAYQNWMTWASGRIQTIANEYSRGWWEHKLAEIERQRYPPGQSGIVDLSSTTTEGGHTGGGSKGGGGK